MPRGKPIKSPTGVGAKPASAKKSNPPRKTILPVDDLVTLVDIEDDDLTLATCKVNMNENSDQPSTSQNLDTADSASDTRDRDDTDSNKNQDFELIEDTNSLGSETKTTTSINSKKLTCDPTVLSPKGAIPKHGSALAVNPKSSSQTTHSDRDRLPDQDYLNDVYQKRIALLEETILSMQTSIESKARAQIDVAKQLASVDTRTDAVTDKVGKLQNNSSSNFQQMRTLAEGNFNHLKDLISTAALSNAKSQLDQLRTTEPKPVSENSKSFASEFSKNQLRILKNQDDRKPCVKHISLTHL